MRSCDLSANDKNCDITLNCVLIMHMPLYNKLSIQYVDHIPGTPVQSQQ